MNRIIGNEQFTVLKNATYRRHIIQAVLLGAIVAVVIYGAVSWHNRRTATYVSERPLDIGEQDIGHLARTLASALDPYGSMLEAHIGSTGENYRDTYPDYGPPTGQPFTYSEAMLLLNEGWQPLRDEVKLIINQ